MHERNEKSGLLFSRINLLREMPPAKTKNILASGFDRWGALIQSAQPSIPKE
jgi:hypothetical protein